MTTKRRKLIAFILLAVIGGVIAYSLLRRDDEPTYQGRRLSEWLALYEADIYSQQTPEFAQAEKAVRSIGTNALPYFLKWMRYEPPSWRRRLRQVLPARVWDNETFQNWTEGAGSKRALFANLGLGILGTNAVAVLPELRAMMKDNAAPSTARRAISAMGSMGESAIPILREGLSDTNQTGRYAIVYSYAMMAYNLGTNACLPYLLEALTNDNAVVRKSATNVIQRMAPDALPNAAPK